MSSAAVLLASLAIAWLNLLLTARWSHVAGSINGPKYPLYVAALAVASILAWRARAEPLRLDTFSRVFFAGCLSFLLVAFVRWFPPASWGLIPFLDDWPPRYQSTVDGVRLLSDGAFSGWRWTFLGGYPTATDITQDLTLWAAIPMWLLGHEVGFHAAHLVLFLAIPALVWLDLRIAGSERDLRWMAAGLAALLSTNYSYFLIRSGDTNSLAGVVGTLATLTAAHAARAGVRGGSIGLIAALAVTSYSHRGFFVYAIFFLALDALAARDWRSAARMIVAAAAASVAALPITWDLWRYPSYFILNNVELQPAPFTVMGFVQKVYYNVELLVRPGRWFNDYSGLVNVFLPVIGYVAWRARDRVRFYALATLTVTLLLVRLNYSWFGYAFLRPLHLLPVLVAPALAWFIIRATGSRRIAYALTAVIALYIQVWWGPVPHVRTVQDFDQAYVSRLAQLPGHMVLVENAFHRDVDVSETGSSLPTPFEAHYEALLPAATGRLLYAGMWDGWQWTPARDQVFANGTFRGRALAEVPVADLERELRRWGVSHLLVWSETAKAYLRGTGRFAGTWQTDRWEEFVLEDADPRAVATSSGAATLEGTTMRGATVRLTGARRGDQAIVRANYHPAWEAYVAGVPLALTDVGGQLGFTVPADGDLVVELVYPARRWLLLVAIGGIAAGWLGLRPLKPRAAGPISGRTGAGQA